MQKPLKYISREKEYELIEKLVIQVDNSNFTPHNTAVLMVSPDYSATVAMHLAHAWSRSGDILEIIPVDVPFPAESVWPFIEKLRDTLTKYCKYDGELPSGELPKHLVLVEAGIITGNNWKWIIDVLNEFGFERYNLTLVALCENLHSKTKSDYVGEYYDGDKEELAFYFERFNRHWASVDQG